MANSLNLENWFTFSYPKPRTCQGNSKIDGTKAFGLVVMCDQENTS